MFRIAHNRGLSHVARRRTLGEELPALADGAPGPEARVAGREEVEQLFAALRALQIPHRQVLTLALEGMELADIGACLGITADTAAVRLSRARAAWGGGVRDGTHLDATDDGADPPVLQILRQKPDRVAGHRRRRRREVAGLAGRRSLEAVVKPGIVQYRWLRMQQNFDAPSLEREAAAVLGHALAHASVLHLPGRRNQHRAQVERAIELAYSALTLADGVSPETVAGARSTLVKAHAARARDARHGAGQLSLGAQRAPTRADCDDGWQRVEELVGVAEASAVEAARLALLLDTPAAQSAARMAEAAAKDARRLVRERNHAYTFHADPGFSFGEGWYLAAAAVLAGVAIQIEPGKPQTSQAERFLRDAGLGTVFQPYRSRPRANKHLPELVARAFRADPNAAQRRLRAAFLGDAPISPAVVDWTDQRLAGAAADKTVLLWVRHGTHQPERNTKHPELVELARRGLDAGLLPVLVGDALRGGEAPAGAVDCTLFWKDPLFQGPDMRRAQLQLFERMRRAYGLVGQLGVTTAGMDGPALMGLPTVYLTEAPNPRLGTWVGAVPGYDEIVRSDAHLEQVSRTLRRWATERA